MVKNVNYEIRSETKSGNFDHRSEVACLIMTAHLGLADGSRILNGPHRGSKDIVRLNGIHL